MSDENKTESAGIVPGDLETQIYNDAMAMLHGEQKTEEAKTDDQPKEEVKEETKKEETAEVKEEPQVEAKTETPAPDTAKPETKPLYTPEEIEKEISTNGDLAKLDSSRLSAEGKLIQTSMQRGLTPKLQRAADIEKNYNALLQKAQQEAGERAKAEAERLFEKEKEDFGEDLANYRKEIREIRAELGQNKQEREQERQAFQAAQQKVAAQQFHLAYMEKAKDFGIPTTQDWEDVVMARIYAENQVRSMNGDEFISIEDGLRMVSSTVGLSSIDNLDKLLDANPKLREAFENRISEKQAKKKQAGPTVVKSSSGSGGKSEVKPTTTEKEEKELRDISRYDLGDVMVQDALAELRKQKG